MSFLHPEFLYYMLPPMFILFAFLFTQKTQEENFFSQEVMDKLRVSANTLTLQARNVLFLMIGTLIVFALAGPVINDGKIEIKAKSTDIMIALDISDSMLGEDVYPNRLKLAKQKALTLLKSTQTQRVGVIAFAQNSYLVSPLSFDSSAVAFLLRALDTTSITEKGTNFLSMLEVVNKSMKTESNKYLLIVSDGGDSKDFSKEIAYAKENHIVVFVLGVGTTKGAPIKQANGEFIKYHGEIMISKLNEEIQNLATKTGGVYIKSLNSNADVKAMIREIDAHSEKKELKSQTINRYIPLFYYPLGLALFLLLIATSSMSKREKVHLPLLFVLTLFFSHTSELNAGALDFMELKDAKESYAKGEYDKSQKIYETYQKDSQKSDVYYNIGNSLYKQGKYKEAINSYKKAHFNDAKSRAENFANLGNAYVKTGDEKLLSKAVSSYEESLKLNKDKDVQENLEAVKKFIKKKKEQKKKEDKDKKKDQKKSKDQKKNKKDKNDKSNQDKKNKDSDKSDKKSDQKSKKKSDKDNKKKQEKKSNEKKSDKQNSDQKKKDKSEQKEKAKELKDQKKDKEKKSAQKTDLKQMQDKMSDDEEKKWLKQLSNEHSTYLYRLNKTNKIEENRNEKPW